MKEKHWSDALEKFLAWQSCHFVFLLLYHAKYSGNLLLEDQARSLTWPAVKWLPQRTTHPAYSAEMRVLLSLK